MQGIICSEQTMHCHWGRQQACSGCTIHRYSCKEYLSQAQLVDMHLIAGLVLNHAHLMVASYTETATNCVQRLFSQAAAPAVISDVAYNCSLAVRHLVLILCADQKHQTSALKSILVTK